MHPCDQTNKGGCSDLCEKDGDNAKCKCSKNGFQLDSDAKTCCKYTFFLEKYILSYFCLELLTI